MDEQKKEDLSEKWNVMNGSFIGSGILATDNRLKFLEFLKESYTDNELLEEKRKRLTVRCDFSLTEIFSFIDVGQSGYIS